jgi:glycosyltransferase involved in cell wall biosynthesis
MAGQAEPDGKGVPGRPPNNGNGCMIKVAYICEPYLGGLFSFFREMRPAFQRIGIDFRCVAPYPEHRYSKARHAGDEGTVFCADETSDDVGFIGTLARHLVEEGYRGVVVVPGNSLASTLLPCILPAGIVRIAMVPHNGRGVYLPTAKISGHLDWIVPVNKLLHDDLVGRYRLEPEQVKMVFIGIDTARFPLRTREAGSGRLTLAYTSRLEDLQKNIFILPRILDAALKLGGKYEFRILCGGPDEPKLREKFRQLGLLGHVRFDSGISREAMLGDLALADVFLMTSRFEGCPHALIEAMASGCVPVVSKLRGIFDTMVEDGREGYWCELQDPLDFARRLHELAHDPEKRREMGAAARERAVRDFDVRQKAEAYRDLLAAPRAGRCMTELAVEEAFRRHGRLLGPGWRSLIPPTWKKWVRTWMARMGKSV